MIRQTPEESAPPEPEVDAEQVQRWSVPECPFVISYSTEIAERLRRRSMEAFQALAHGGLEIGGVLFGRVHPNARTPARVEILAEREIVCSHASGPGFLLSDEEETRIPTIFEQARCDPEIAAFPVVGLWVSHSRTSLTLAEQDAVLFQRHFPSSWQVVLVLKPGSAGTTGTFFFRVGGKVQPHQETHQFAWLGTALMTAPAAIVPEAIVPEALKQTHSVERMPRRYGLRTLLAAMAFAALTGAAITWFLR